MKTKTALEQSARKGAHPLSVPLQEKLRELVITQGASVMAASIGISIYAVARACGGMPMYASTRGAVASYLRIEDSQP